VQAPEHKDVLGRPSKVKLTPLPEGYPPLDHATFRTLFHRPYFHVRMVSDVAGVSLGGALKNIVALAAGFVDGKGWGDNAKAAVMRVGLLEEVKFGLEFFGQTCRGETFTEESCGVADMITSCASGRNFRCAKMATERGVSVAEIEKTELNGQMLQGTSTAKEVNSFLSSRGRAEDYPLFTAVIGMFSPNSFVYLTNVPQISSKVERPSTTSRICWREQTMLLLNRIRIFLRHDRPRYHLSMYPFTTLDPSLFKDQIRPPQTPRTTFPLGRWIFLSTSYATYPTSM